MSRKQGSNRTDIEIGLERNGKVSIGFGNRQEKHAEVDASINHFSDFDPVYLPPKEMISSTEHFRTAPRQ